MNRYLMLAMFVLCCCRTFGGGECCAEVDTCSVPFIPGCFCTFECAE